MKNNRVKKLMTSAVILLAGLAFAVSSYAQQDSSQEKMKLMFAAMNARESGDLMTAKSALEELARISPEDTTTQRLLVVVNNSIAEEKAKAEAERKAGATRVASTSPSVAVATGESVVLTEEGEVADPDAVLYYDAQPEASMEQANEEALMNMALLREQKTVLAVYMLIDEAEDLSDNGKTSNAVLKLDEAREKLDVLGVKTPAVNEARQSLNEAYGYVAKVNAKVAAKEGNFVEAKSYAQEYSARVADADDADVLIEEIDSVSEDPYNNKLETVSPDYVARQKEVNNLMQKGRVQYLYGDYDGARRTFKNIEALDPHNMQAKTYLGLISEKLSVAGDKSYQLTRQEMINEVDGMWRYPTVYQGDTVVANVGSVSSPIAAKLEDIIIDEIILDEVPLSRVVNTLSILSTENDKSNDISKGVNIALIGKDDSNTVTLSLRNAPLGQILYLATRQVGYTYDIQDNVVLVTKGSADASILNLETEYFPVLKTVLDNRILGLKTGSGNSDSSDPFASSSSDSSESSDVEVRTEKLLKFFERNGVQFGTGTAVSCEDSGISVTNTPTNIEKVRNILLRYSDVEQVEVETKFLEVNHGTLDMLAFNYSFTKDGDVMFQSNNRVLANTIAQTNAGATPTTISSPVYSDYYTDSWGNSVGGSIVEYTTTNYEQNIPSLPSSINLASTALDTANAVLGVINGVTAEIVVNALSQEQGTDLLTAPRLTVVSGETASINVSQVMFYPTTFSDVQSDVGSSNNNNNNNNNNNSSAGVTITPGTPADFVEVNVGVTMEITPEVQEDKSILISLNPVVREFEGFMEYGGLAIAISSGTTVTVPSGFIQPVFSVREINTKVYVFDGATIVLGGLVREEVKTVNDGVPFFQDIPLIGTLFRSKGEARQKKNLLIFVTANRITPGGSLRNALFSGTSSSSVYQNPVVRSPGGNISRVKDVEENTEN